MMPTDRFERHLPLRLADLADPQTPDYFDDLLWQTAHTSQRRAWTFLEGWLPMLEISRRPVALQMPWRPVAVLVLIVIGLIVSLVLAGGQRPPPPLFGPAANGLIALSKDGDIYTFDTRTGQSRAIVTGPDQDLDPLWSQDGTHLLFRRVVSDDAGLLYIARGDGGGLRRLTPDPLPNVASYELSPDGRSVAIVADVKGIPSLFVARSDGSGIGRLDTGTIVWGATFRPTGADILFVGAQGVDRAYSGIYLVDVDGTDLRTLVEPQVDAQIEGVAEWSPDGSRIAYARWEPSVVRQNLRVHVMSPDGTHDDIVGHSAGAWLEAGPRWSPDGKRLLIERNAASREPSHPSRPAIVTLDGSVPDVVIRADIDAGTLMAWSPDGSAIQATPVDPDGNRAQQLLWDPLTGDSKPAPWVASSYPTWQRVSP